MTDQTQGKIWIFVDADNLYGAKRTISKKEMDDGTLLTTIAKNLQADEILYYFNLLKIKNDKETNIDKENIVYGYLDFAANDIQWAIKKVGFSINIFPQTKVEVDSQIISDMAELLFRFKEGKETIKEIILISGDRSFYKILCRAKREGIKIKIISGKEMCSRKLKKIADEVIFLEDIIQ